MAGVPLRLTLARSYGEQGAHYRVLAHRLDDDPASSQSAGKEVGSIELNRRIELPGGEVFSIARRGRLFAPVSVLLPGADTTLKAPTLAAFRRERIGLWWPHVLVTAGNTEERFVLRRRAVFGSPANADVVSDAPHAETVDLANMPVVLRVEKVGAWRQRLQARWLDSTQLSLPVVLFVLNVLADEDRRAAIAASAGAAGV
jgi:hypothetical protein